MSYSSADLAAVSLVAAAIAAWAMIADGAFSVGVLLACEAAFFAFYLVGSLVASAPSLSKGILFDLPLRLLVGYGIVNSALLLLAWTSPLGIVGNFGLLLASAGAAFFATGKCQRRPSGAAALWAVALCIVAASLWCQDSIRPSSRSGDEILVRPWLDGFYHAVHIRIFAASHGAASIEDFRLSGVQARPYHYGMYLLPAFVKQAAGLHSYAAFAGLLAPVGVFFTGLAAYSFIGSLWGAWSGFAAAAALLLLPDGAQQGMRNTFMSYHWLTQISPSATYGLALLAIAWLFVIKGCTQGSRLQVIVGLGVSCVVSLYKLHYFIASALLLLLVPALFFSGLSGLSSLSGRQALRKRVQWAGCACAIYALAIVLCESVPGVPHIRFDGSSVAEILRLIRTFAMPGAIADFLVLHTGANVSKAVNLLVGIPYVLLAVLGVFVPLLAALLLRMRGRAPKLYTLFPLLLIANFLLMFFGLALDFDSSTPDELSHRPLLIVYFFVVSWIGGALGRCLTESKRFHSWARPVIVGLATALLVVPALLGPGVQTMWAMPTFSPTRLPSAALRVADYIRTHGDGNDVFQDSQFDRGYVLGALSERRAFVAHSITRMPFRSEMVETRTDAIERFMGLRQPKLIVATARTLGFRWFVLEYGDHVDWPPEIANHPVLEAGPFKLYEF